MAENNRPTVNIDIDEEWKNVCEGQKRESTFNEKNYLNVRLEKGEAQKKITIRLLPMDPNGGTPFAKVHFHNVKVNEELVKPGMKPYKNFVCLNPRNNPTIDHEKFGNKCPFCEINKDAYKKFESATTEAEKEMWKKISLENKSKESVIVRCIERGAEEDGVKFWKFNLKIDNSDPYHKIMELYKTRKEEGAKVGREINILDLYNGRDLTITVKRGNTENQTVVDVIESSVETPLTDNEELFDAWLNDSKKWQDVFTAKPYDYLQLVQEGKVPWYDRVANKWVDKAEYDTKNKEKKEEKEEVVKEADEKIKQSIANLKTSSTANYDNQVVEDVSDDDESDLPF